jgi:hypothetical protein
MLPNLKIGVLRLGAGDWGSDFHYFIVRGSEWCL